MTKMQNDSGVNYTLGVFENKWQPRIVFWLGFRPFKAADLVQLIPEITGDQVAKEIQDLQNLRIVNPILDEEGKYSLSDDGYDLRNIIISMGVWGRQQLDDSEDQTSAQIVEPEPDAPMSNLIEYGKKLDNYL